MYSAIIFVGYIPRTATEIAARLQVPSPKLLLQVRKFRQQMMGCFTLQPLQQSADRYLRRNRKEQMHMILRYVPLHYLHFVLPANLTDQVAHSHRYISRQRRPSVLRDPHQMQMNLKYRVRAPSVFRHPLSLPAARLLKPSPVRRGLQPSQTGTVNVAKQRTGCGSRSAGTATKISVAPMSIPAALG